MTLTLEQIRTELPESEAIADLLEVFEAGGFELGAWQSGGIRRSVFQLMAKFCQIGQSFADSLSRIHFNSDATGTALTHYSRENYGNERNPAVATVGWIRLSGLAIGPPYTVVAGDVVVSDGIRTYRNITGGTIPAGGYIDLQFSAEVPGAAGDVGNGVITTMVTTYAGVSCGNPAYGTTGTWIITHGAEAENDAALQARNAAKNSTLSVLKTLDDRYEYIARTAYTNCRVKVDSTNPRGPGTVDVYVAGPTGAAGAGDVTNVSNAIQASGFGDLVQTVAAPSLSIAPAGTVYYVGTLGLVQAAVNDAIDAYLATAPIGGFNLTPGPAAIIPEDGITTAIRGAAGVVGFAYTSGQATPTAFQVAVRGSTAGLSYVQVSG